MLPIFPTDYHSFEIFFDECQAAGMDKELCEWPLWLRIFFEQVQQISRKFGLDQKSNINQPRRELIPRLPVFGIDHKNEPGAVAESGYVSRNSESVAQQRAGVRHDYFIPRLADFIECRGRIVCLLRLFVAGGEQEIENLLANLLVRLNDQNGLAAVSFHTQGPTCVSIAPTIARRSSDIPLMTL